MGATRQHPRGLSLAEGHSVGQLVGKGALATAGNGIKTHRKVKVDVRKVRSEKAASRHRDRETAIEVEMEVVVVTVNLERRCQSVSSRDSTVGVHAGSDIFRVGKHDAAAAYVYIRGTRTITEFRLIEEGKGGWKEGNETHNDPLVEYEEKRRPSGVVWSVEEVPLRFG